MRQAIIIYPGRRNDTGMKQRPSYGSLESPGRESFHYSYIGQSDFTYKDSGIGDEEQPLMNLEAVPIGIHRSLLRVQGYPSRSIGVDDTPIIFTSVPLVSLSLCLCWSDIEPATTLT